MSEGGSLSMWRRYLGDEAVIFGVDINEDCARYDGIDGSVRIGSQVDREFMGAVVEEMGGIDVVLDDGSHLMKHVRGTLEHLMPKLEAGGTYMIEDLHTAYWRTYGGGKRSDDNFFKYIRELTDDMHHWYHASGIRHPEVSNFCNSIHVYDSICVLEKNAGRERARPTHSKIQTSG